MTATFTPAELASFEPGLDQYLDRLPNAPLHYLVGVARRAPWPRGEPRPGTKCAGDSHRGAVALGEKP
jgi:hypothetical protein